MRRLIIALLVCGCGAPPVENDASARGAMRAASDDGADPAGDSPADPNPGPAPDSSSAEPAIIGGTPCTTPTGIYMSLNDRFRCSGTLIAPDVVLTAAHCVVDYDKGGTLSSNAFTFGRGPVACGLGDRRAARVVMDPGWDGKDSHDLAIVKLDGPMSGGTVAMRLDQPPGVGDPVDTTGYGAQGFGTPASFASACATSHVTGFGYNGDLGSIRIGADGGLCHGDSGGGVFLHASNILIGVNSAVMDGTTCTGEARLAPLDNAFIDQSLEALASVSTCTAGMTASCRPTGAACFVPSNVDTPLGQCQYGVATCEETGHYGDCIGYVGPTPEICGDQLDNDCDGTTDEDCPATNGQTCPYGFTFDEARGACDCTASCAPGTALDTITCHCEMSCGDGVCGFGETRSSCPWDCSQCGDRWCQGFEDEWNCPDDCGQTFGCICGVDCAEGTPGCEARCGDGICEVVNEDPATCPSDCSPPSDGGSGGGVEPPSGCGEDYWNWLVDSYGYDDVATFYSEDCGLVQ